MKKSLKIYNQNNYNFSKALKGKTWFFFNWFAKQSHYFYNSPFSQ